MTVSQTTFAPLHRADGSATYSQGGYTVISAVNGPIEVQRRDEIPDEAAIEVNVRPAVGVGGPRERHVESLLTSLLRHVILTHLHPRSLIQITLQILSTPSDETTSHIPLLPPLISALTPALLHSSLPLATTPLSVLIALPKSGEATPYPSTKQIREAASVHAFAFGAEGEVLLAESEGRFTGDEWEAATGKAREVCLGSGAGEGKGLLGELRGKVAGFARVGLEA
ncbi:hypothetical protein K461DRAFT_320122 [Myriangium duriaei CBS 260.36]|uniref:Exoribonuclease phosphorolytic domain-containing protein n=1 Tax=Myriangium duriaei CBS 260.36 TaxID=1168546 RepID=A0A9P4J7S4_9PEZI|nr:hypothetical protein K461DRAFT_320122 [Myriangium duriaei CBS 260.36]